MLSPCLWESLWRARASNAGRCERVTTVEKSFWGCSSNPSSSGEEISHLLAERGLEAGWQFLPVGLELSSPGQSENTRSKYEKCSATKEDSLETCASQQLRSDRTDTPYFWPQARTAGRGCLTLHFKRGQGGVKWLVFLPVSLLVYTLSRFTKAFGKCLWWVTGCHCLSKEVQHTGWAFTGGKNPDPKN